MANRFSQRSEGSQSPNIGGDQITNNIGNKARNRSELMQRAIALEVELRTTHQRLEWKVKVLRTLTGVTIGLAILAALLILRPRGGGPADDQKPAAAGATVTVTASAAAPVSASGVTEAGGWPVAQPIACKPGGWVTVLRSSKPQDRLDEFLATTQLYKSRSNAGAPLLKYAYLDESSCGTLVKGLWVLYLGPFEGSAEALAECNRLGWTAAADVRHCFGLAIDTNIQKGTRRVRPDGAVG
jgi:hypothetical protein